MPDAVLSQSDSSNDPGAHRKRDLSGFSSSTSLHELGAILLRRRVLIGSILGSLLLLCLLYCLIAPSQYDATARIALRTERDSALNLDPSEASISSSILSAPLQLETLAGELRSDQLAWEVINQLQLYRAPGFMGNFANRFPGFHPETPAVDAQAWLLERFQKRLSVQSIPRTLLIQVRFRSRDAALSASVVNTLLRTYSQEDSDSQVQATRQTSAWLNRQLGGLKNQVDRDQQRLRSFQNQHGLLQTPDTLSNGQLGATEHNAMLLEIDELGKQLVAATSDRIYREAEFRAASEGDPELVVASDPSLQSEDGSFSTALLVQIRAARSQLEQEQAQLNTEHGPNFPRVVEIRRQLQDLDHQKQTEDAKLVERFRVAWQTASDREQLVRKSLEATTSDGMKLNEAATEYAVMREEADSSHELYMQLLEKVQEAGIAAGTRGSKFSIVDLARQPAKPAAPDLPLYMLITFFAGIWLAVGTALLGESMSKSKARAAMVFMAALLAGAVANAQAPTPSLDGLPTGVARIPFTPDNKTAPNPKEAPGVWGNAAGGFQAGVPPLAGVQSNSPMPAPLAAGDFVDISEYHMPEFHTVVRVSPAGVVTLPMIGEVNVEGMDELSAAHSVEAALVAKGMLLHPQVVVLVISYAGQDVSVLGEVTRPGVYPYTLHHRLLDLISAASGTTSSAGRLVNIYHRDDPKTPFPCVLDPGGNDTSGDHNPELKPGDTVQVSRAGLVYVVGDVVRPGGFAVDPTQGLTIVQALALAWGPSQNALTRKAVLIREHNGSRTMTTLNLKRMLHGQEPDQSVHDRDIIYVPDSMARNLLNRSLESAIQSTIGISIYSGLVYSQRY